MRIDYAKLRRIVLCTGTCFAVLGVVQVAGAAAPSAAFDAFMGRVVGNQTTVGFGTGGTPLATSSAGLGTPATVGNMGVSQAGSGVTVGGNVKVPLGGTGKAAGAAASAAVSRAAFLRGAAAALGGGVGGAIVVTGLPLLADWLRSSGKITVNPETGALGKVEPGWGASDGYLWWGKGRVSYDSADDACASYFPFGGYNQQGNWDTFQWAGYVVSQGASAVCPAKNSLGEATTNSVSVERGARGTCPAGNYVRGGICSSQPGSLPISMDDIVEYMDAPEAPALTPAVFVEGVTKAGIDPFGSEPAKVKVSGPSAVAGEKVQSSTQTRVIPGTTTEVGQGYSGETQPATRTRISTQSYNVTYNDNRVSYTTTNNTTTNITNNVTGGSSTTTETEQREDDGETECEKNPQSLSCADLDTPDDEIPKTTASVAYQDENPFGGGACPASKYTNVGGQSVKVWDWEQTCGYITGPVYWITVTLGAFAATMIVAGGTGARL